MRGTAEATELDLARMAALIDGEGNISISTTKANPNSNSLQITVGNVQQTVLEWCRDRFGGAIYPLLYKKSPSPRRAPIKRWRIQNLEAAAMLERCLPYFFGKREQADIAIAFQTTFDVPRTRVAPALRELREQYRLQLQSLTKKGPKQAPTAKPAEPRQGSLFAR